MSAFGSSSSGGDITGRALNRVKKELEKFNEAKESNEAEGECLFILLGLSYWMLSISSIISNYMHVQFKTYRLAHRRVIFKAMACISTGCGRIYLCRRGIYIEGNV